MYKSMNLYVLLLSLFLFSFVDGNKKKSDLELDHIHGQVKAIHLYDYKRADQKTLAIDPAKITLPDTTKHMIYNYDKNGNLAEHTNSDGKKLEVYSYNNSGYRIHSVNYNIKGKILSEATYTYDMDGNVIENKNLTYKKDTIILTNTFKNDDKGVPQEMNVYSKNKFLYKWLFKYNDKGIKIEESKYYPKDSLAEKWVYKYDDKGNKTEMAMYNDSLVEKFVYTYNDSHDVTEDILYGRLGRLYHDYVYNYTYDEKGNWNKKVFYEGSTLKGVTIRVIEYY